MRLQAFLARSGAAPSRRKAEALISLGKVRVNSRTARLGESVSFNDRVFLDDKPVELPPKYAYFVFNKPAGYVTALKDERNCPAIAELIPADVPGLVPVGRLDADTTGLLLLTNDGKLAHRVAHPSYGVEKEYELTLVTPEHGLESRLAALASGSELEDGKMLPPKLTRLRHTRERTMLNITIHEGRNRIIRRACAAVGLRLISLKRVRVGPVWLGALAEGRYRSLTKKELKILKNAGRLNLE
ncbi:MAG: rRNA pseudouridine synthase [Rubrobacter sp.]|nr:rRNA pseudouridine synthase [Rubrobacter sp.]